MFELISMFVQFMQELLIRTHLLTIAMQQVSTYQSHETVDTGIASHSDQIEEVLYQFSKICLMVLKDKIGVRVCELVCVT